MLLAISARGIDLDTVVEPRFGRCPYFIFVDPDTMEFRSMDNTSAMDAGGAGISAAQTIANEGVQAVLTGNCGPNAFKVLSSAGIQIVTGVSGSVKDAVQNYKKGNYKTSPGANVSDHFGMEASPGTGGGGMGKGGGM
ncbi:MAG: NifB/NifX family molybdenum-iron cluster-binding protein, partial [Acidobacteria bacterium]|nr:NifB/NifX family molybdenum-iron cluster-binding protein [Acidobacteriota bacterium]